VRSTAARGVRGAALVAAATLVAALAACSGATDDAADAPASHDYRAGLRSYPHVPANTTRAPVVVMVPGGAWRGADPTGLQPLAAALAERGVLAVPVEIRAESDGVVDPVPMEDITCALADAVAVARKDGIEPTRTVLLGHSSGAHLSAVVTLAPERYTPACDAPRVAPDALVGLAGPYDIRTFEDAASALFPPDATPAQWDAANPVLLAANRPDVPVLLLHGDADETVPSSFSADFAAALRLAGHPVTLTVLPGEDHDTIYSAATAAEPIAQWLQGLPQD
jgi:acetyl esterase/lipase